ncbi:hypothetical protein ROS217_19152 [Roseovarius sp. 217]|nr:hypothetical protein ROS217_19152 [Roseovarius sp. 217]
MPKRGKLKGRAEKYSGSGGQDRSLKLAVVLGVVDPLIVPSG